MSEVVPLRAAPTTKKFGVVVIATFERSRSVRSADVKICIAILSWNAADKLERAVRSALDQSSPGVEVIVADNGSTDGSAELLPDFERLGCRTIRNHQNLGYAEGMNIAYRHTDADVFVAMNCDAVLHPEFIASAVDVLEEQPNVGIVGALVYRLEGDTLPWDRQNARSVDGFVIGLRMSMRTRLLLGEFGLHRSFKVNGACPVLRRAMIESLHARYGVAPFDPVFDTYGEDIDLAFKAWELGWETVVSSEVIAAHERSYGERQRIYDRRGRLRVNSIAARHLNAWRHLPSTALVVSVPILVMGDLGFTARQLLQGDRQAARDLVQAWTRVWRFRRNLARYRSAHSPLPAATVRTFRALMP